MKQWDFYLSTLFTLRDFDFLFWKSVNFMVRSAVVLNPLKLTDFNISFLLSLNIWIRPPHCEKYYLILELKNHGNSPQFQKKSWEQLKVTPPQTVNQRIQGISAYPRPFNKKKNSRALEIGWFW